MPRPRPVASMIVAPASALGASQSCGTNPPSSVTCLSRTPPTAGAAPGPASHDVCWAYVPAATVIVALAPRGTSVSTTNWIVAHGASIVPQPLTSVPVGATTSVPVGASVAAQTAMPYLRHER